MSDPFSCAFEPVQNVVAPLTYQSQSGAAPRSHGCSDPFRQLAHPGKDGAEIYVGDQPDDV